MPGRGLRANLGRMPLWVVVLVILTAVWVIGLILIVVGATWLIRHEPH